MAEEPTPPPATPLLRRIIDALVEVLEAITIEAGYSHTVTAVHRPRRVPVAYENGQVCLELGGGTAAGPEETPEGFAAFDQQATVSDFVIPSDFAADADAPIDVQAVAVLADLLKALFADPNLGGLAYPGISIVSYDTFVTDAGRYAGLELVLSIGYRHPENDPTFAAGE